MIHRCSVATKLYAATHKSGQERLNSISDVTGNIFLQILIQNRVTFLEGGSEQH